MIHMNIARINADKGHVFDSFTETFASREEIPTFRQLQRELGRCISAVYIDDPDGTPRKIGWCFQKRQQYSDPVYKMRQNAYRYNTYLEETWVSFYDVTTEPLEVTA